MPADIGPRTATIELAPVGPSARTGGRRWIDAIRRAAPIEDDGFASWTRAHTAGTAAPKDGSGSLCQMPSSASKSVRAKKF
jgi:hypothetical protein